MRWRVSMSYPLLYIMFSFHLFSTSNIHENSRRCSPAPWSLQDAEALRQRLLSEAHGMPWTTGKTCQGTMFSRSYELLWVAMTELPSNCWKLLVHNCVEPCRAPCRFLLHQSWTGYFWIARAAQRINRAKRGATYWRHDEDVMELSLQRHELQKRCLIMLFIVWKALFVKISKALLSCVNSFGSDKECPVFPLITVNARSSSTKRTKRN